ncbi:hypothetical protein EBT16_10115, partial [bacterium]|nr:hypothetical protein [bacterium]
MGLMTCPCATSASNPQIVNQISSKSLSGPEIKEISQLLGIQVGKTLDLNRVDQELKRVFLNGKFGDVRIFSEQKKHLNTLFIEGVKLKKVGVVDWSQIDSKILEESGVEKMLSSGQKVEIKELKTVTGRIKSALEDHGYADPNVDYRLVPTSDQDIMDIHFLVDKKDRTIVREIMFKGVDQDIKEGLLSRLRFREGDFFDKAVVEKSSQLLLEYLINNQYPGAKVKWGIEKSETNPNEVLVIFDVSVGTRYRFFFKGNEFLETNTLRSLIGFDLLNQSDATIRIKRTLEDKYRSLGYHFVLVDVDMSPPGKEAIVSVNVQVVEGPKVLVDSVVFDGLWSDSLGNPASLFFENAVGVLKRRIFWEAGIEESTQQFVNNLRERGFLSASVTGPRVFFSDDRKGVQLFYDLQLGNLYEIKKISFKGNSNVPTQSLLEVLPFGVGDTLNRDALKAASEGLKTKIQSSGFLDVKVTVEERTSEVAPGNRIEGTEVVFQIEEGPRYFVGTIQVEGLVRTMEKVVRREIVIQSGEPFDPEKV